MRDPVSRFFSSFSSSQDSLIQRIRENFQQILAPARIFPSSANGAPLHLMTQGSQAFANRSRTVSFLTHMLLASGVFLLGVRSPKPSGGGPETPPHNPFAFTFFRAPDNAHFGRPSLGVKSGGGENDPRPARHGLLAPGSSMPILPPRRIVNTAPELPVPTAVFDPNASPFPPVITNLGLPWMKNDSNSAGPGSGHGFGSGKDGGMGDDEGTGAGQGDRYGGPYANAMTLPSCAYCPDPQYTDEAREAKTQGRVMLRVLIGADGRPAQVQVMQGIGMGLDERAVQSVRSWKFVPAHDAARRPVATWVTIEVVFRLI